MATTVLTNLSSGAPSLTGVNGALNAVLDWALPQAGWAIEYTATNARVYRPGSGNRRRLSVRHDSAISGSVGLATIRGCEDATGATALVDAFPLVSQIGETLATFCVGTSAAAKEYQIIVSPTFVLMAVGTLSTTTTGWDIFFFGDLPSTIPGDVYNTAILIGNSTAATATTARAMAASLAAGVYASAKVFWCRSVDGSIKSTYGTLNGSVSVTGAAAFCTVLNTPDMRAGYLNQAVREKVAASCNGSSSTTAGALAIVRRGWVPNLWNPLHTSIGSMTSNDTFTDSAYAVGSQFRLAPASTAIACILEISDTWSAPSG